MSTMHTLQAVRPVRALRHLLRVTRVMLSASIKTHMEYRLNFILFVINASMTNLFSLVFLWVVVSRFHSLQGWSLDTLISYYPATAFLSRTGEVPFTQAFAYLTPLVGALLFVVGYGVWSIGLRQYQSTGS